MRTAAGSTGSGAAFLGVRQPDHQYQRQEQQARYVEDVVGRQHECLLVDQTVQYSEALLLSLAAGLAVQVPKDLGDKAKQALETFREVTAGPDPRDELLRQAKA